MFLLLIQSAMSDTSKTLWLAAEIVAYSSMSLAVFPVELI